MNNLVICICIILLLNLFIFIPLLILPSRLTCSDQLKVSIQTNRWLSFYKKNLIILFFIFILLLLLIIIIITRPWPAGLDGIVARIQLHTPRLAPAALGSVELCKN